MSIQITELTQADQTKWRQLYMGYADFYQVPMTDEILDTVWGWIFNPERPFYALVARDEQGQLLGLMHYRAMPSPIRGTEMGFLDDLYVSPQVRGTGVVDSLFNALEQAAQEKGWPIVRWITSEHNYRARAVYDRLADKTDWLTYQLAPYSG